MLHEDGAAVGRRDRRSASATATAAPTSAASAGVRFGKPKPAVGDRCTLTHSATIDWKHTDPGQLGGAETHGGGAEMVLHTEVLAVSGDREIQWKLTYEKDAIHQDRDGKRVRVPSPLEGKAYVAERADIDTIAIAASSSASMVEPRCGLGEICPTMKSCAAPPPRWSTPLGPRPRKDRCCSSFPSS